GNSNSFEFIETVSYGTLTNNSGSSQYTDFTAFTRSVQVGASIDLVMEVGDSNNNDVGGLWVDWNHDGDFTDPDEDITTSWSGHGPHNATINVPASAVVGNTRMRVRIQNGNQNPVVDPCGTTSRGEVEDYSLKVLPASPPPNDDCSSPTLIDVQPVQFTTVGATTDGFFEPQLCDSNGDQNIESDVWFEFAAPCGGEFTATLCGSDFNTRVGVYATCPSGSLEILACNDDACGEQSIVSFTGFKDTVFLIRVGGHFGAQGDGMITVSVECLDDGGCCLTDGTCTLLSPGDCAAAGGVFNGIGTDCVPNPCVQPGACCFGDGSCTQLQDADCVSAGGSYQGDGTECVSAKCPQPATGACCATDGSCSTETEADCASSGGSYNGDDTTCEPGLCALPCPADLDGSGDVGFGDILAVIGAWGPCGAPCPEDVDGSGDVGFGDILVIIGAWGPCP
ncbi:MAG: GEVED domain-containing protein, partial [Planctomycetota bacterium]